ncbi:MAG: poly-gamma-glutamate hydrolase family protein [Pseudomonadota bacterium]
MDRYTSFENLKRGERRDTDYRIERRIGSSGIAILSIHGGEIEPGTTRIADAIAGPEHAFYSFEGIKSRGNLALHITSTCFDEPSAMEIVCQSDIIVSIHGSARMEPVVHLGGLDVELKNRIRDKLRDAGFQITECSGPPFGGADHANICNLCGRGMGVQMEISRGLRSLMFRDLTPEGREHRTGVFDSFTQAVREAIEPFAAIYAENHPHDGTD